MVERDEAPLGNLRADVTTMIGRRAESDDVRSLMESSRLVTLTGQGGVGKTRLARHVARSVERSFPEGVWVVPLAELTEPDLLAATVMTTLGRQGAGGTSRGDLVDFLRRRRLLLVLDNCEHLAGEAATLAAGLLEACPRLVLLVTSREALNVAGEALYPVPPLSVPAPGTAAGEARQYDAVTLFLDRAARLGKDFSRTPDDQAAVVALSRKLEGLPLAIELAASSTRWLSLHELLARADDRLAGPPRVRRNAPDRHQSVRASLDYSHELCSAPARRLWGIFSVFRGGTALEAVESVGAAAGLDAREVEGALFELVDKSIVVFDGARYRMVETIRQYGAELLDASGDANAVAAAHLRYFADLADALEREWFGPDQTVLLHRMMDDQANVRAALQSSLTLPGGDGIGLRMATALWTYWIGCGRPAEGRLWLDQLLAVADVAPRERAPALWVAGFLTAVDGDVPASQRLLEECLVTSRAAGDEASAAHARGALGVGQLFEGRVNQAIESLEECIDLERGLDDAGPYFADMLINLGLAYACEDRRGEARAVLAEALEVTRARGELLLQSWALLFTGLVDLLDGDAESARTRIQESLVVKRTVSNDQGLVWALEVLAWTELELGRPEQAALLLGASEARAADFGPVYHGFGSMMNWHHEYAARAEHALGANAFASDTERGAALTLADAVAVALGETVDQPAGLSGSGGELADLPLTQREREIAGLVALGRTSKEIAVQLVIAPRTVDTHVQNILSKLGFTSRSQVAALLASRGAVTPDRP